MGKVVIPEGTVFGRLKVLYESEARTKQGQVQYVCECQCQEKNIVTVASSSLRNKLTQSCGCLQKERVKAAHIVKEKNIVDLTDNTFGFWTVKRKISGIGVNTLWECECQCKAVKPVIQSSLVNGLSTSCGCKTKTYAKENIRENLGIIDGTNISIISSDKIPANNTSGIKGVSYRKKLNKWQAYIMFKGKFYNLGHYTILEEAGAVRKIAEEQIFGEFIKWYEQFKKDKKNDKATNQ